MKRAYDVLLAGDPDPTPISQRPAFQALAVETDPLRAIEPYAAISRDLVSRIEPLAAALLAAGQTGEPDVAQIADAIAAERLIGATAISNRLANLGALASPLPRGARDVVWTLISPQLYRMLVLQRGWNDDAYQRWLGKALTDALLRGA